MLFDLLFGNAPPVYPLKGCGHGRLGIDHVSCQLGSVIGREGEGGRPLVRKLLIL